MQKMGGRFEVLIQEKDGFSRCFCQGTAVFLLYACYVLSIKHQDSTKYTSAVVVPWEMASSWLS